MFVSKSMKNRNGGKKIMEYDVKLSKEELDFICNSLRFLENENLNKSLTAVKSMKYKDVKGLYTNKQSFKDDIKYKEKIINEQIQAIDEIIEKLENEMY